MKKCLIITGGEYSPIHDTDGYDMIIACDKGYEYARLDGIAVSVIIGDLDSYQGNIPSNAPVIRLKPEKDDTDTMAAIKLAKEKGCTDIVLTCSLGGRADHLLANLQGGAYAISKGLSFSIIEDNCEIHFLSNGALSFPKKDDFSLSVFSLTDECRGVSLSGVKYPLEAATLTNRFPLGVSNEWLSDKATVSVGDGILAIMLCKK